MIYENYKEHFQAKICNMHVASVLWYVGVQRMSSAFVFKCKDWKIYCSDAGEKKNTEEEEQI